MYITVGINLCFEVHLHGGHPNVQQDAVNTAWRALKHAQVQQTSPNVGVITPAQMQAAAVLCHSVGQPVTSNLKSRRVHIQTDQVVQLGVCAQQCRSMAAGTKRAIYIRPQGPVLKVLQHRIQ